MTQGRWRSSTASSAAPALDRRAPHPQRILAPAQALLRRYGPAKTIVVDVARELAVSHASVYRHFPSKAALRDAVAERWLLSISEAARRSRPRGRAGAARLRRWLDVLIASKRSRALNDAELFATYARLAGEARAVIAAHVDTLVEQLARLIADGVERGEFVVDDPEAAARAVFDATGRFHNPIHASEWTDRGIDAAFDDVWTLVLRGLGADPPG